MEINVKVLTAGNMQNVSIDCSATNAFAKTDISWLMDTATWNTTLISVNFPEFARRIQNATLTTSKTISRVSATMVSLSPILAAYRQ